MLVSSPPCLDVPQNSFVKRAGSLEKIKGIVWGRSGDRVRSRPDNGDGWLSVENQVRWCLFECWIYFV